MENIYQSDPTVTAFMLMEKGELAQAQVLLREILDRIPGQPDALHGMACLARAESKNGLAIGLVGKALQSGTRLPAARSARMHITLGLALLAEGHKEPARAALQVAILLQPSDPRALAGMADALMALGRRDEALSTLQEAARFAADDLSLLARSGELAFQLGRYEDAVAAYRHLVDRCPQEGAVHANLGGALFELHDFDAAASELLSALSLGNRTTQTLNNLGLVEMARGDLVAAHRALEEAAACTPEDPKVLNNFGTVLNELGQRDAAEKVFSRVVLISPDTPEAHRATFNRSTIQLAAGRFVEGWKGFEARRFLINQGSISQSSISQVFECSPEGSDAVAVTMEQGVGDMVQFLRFLPQAARYRPLRIRLPEWEAGLSERLMNMEDVNCLPANGPVKADIPLLSLPGLLKLKDPPSTGPYLRACTLVEKDLIGLAWAGNPQYRFDLRRSVDVKLLEPFSRIAGLRFLSLQRGAALDWMERPKSLDSLTDLIDAAGRCALIISVDTLVAHVAGAVGRPLWLLNRFGGDWRWQGTPWYADVRQFSPQAPDLPAAGWPPVIASVVQALRQRQSA